QQPDNLLLAQEPRTALRRLRHLDLRHAIKVAPFLVGQSEQVTQTGQFIADRGDAHLCHAPFLKGGDLLRGELSKWEASAAEGESRDEEGEELLVEREPIILN